MARSSTSGQGRPVGIPNKNTQLLKNMILAALEEAGRQMLPNDAEGNQTSGTPGENGKHYLLWAAMAEPRAFLALLSRVLPMQITGATAIDQPVNVRMVMVDPKDKE